MLIGSGIPEEHAKEYERGLNEGGIVLVVRPKPGDADAVRGVLSRAVTANSDIL